MHSQSVLKITPRIHRKQNSQYILLTFEFYDDDNQMICHFRNVSSNQIAE